MEFEGKRILITGGTGSLGKALVRRILTDELGHPEKVIVFSRDEEKQQNMRISYLQTYAATDEVIYRDTKRLLEFRIGDVRDYDSVCANIRDAHVIINAAALKQVPTCEYFPYEAVLTNVVGPENIVRAIREHDLSVETVVGVSTDKACKPVNLMGMTKAIQERILINGNLLCPHTRFVCVRYGNVLASRGSVIPLFHSQIRDGLPLTITTMEMTRFLLSIDQAVDTIFAVIRDGARGEMFVPRVPSALVVDIAHALIGDRPVEIKVVGIRPGEKVHEILISEEEAVRVATKGNYYVIQPILPELRAQTSHPSELKAEYSSRDQVLRPDEVLKLLTREKLLVGYVDGDEMLR